MRGLLERLNAGELVIGDGGYVYALEKRGYVTAGPWTPEVVVEHPEAVRQLHREFLRAGADVMQTFTFHAEESALNKLPREDETTIYDVSDINRAACLVASEVAKEGDALVGGSLSQTGRYRSGGGKTEVQEIFRKQLNDFTDYHVDFLAAEFFDCIEEMEWAIEVLKHGEKPVWASMCIGPDGDVGGVPVAECSVRMARAGAGVVGINCHFGPLLSLTTFKIMKQSLDAAGINIPLLVQPCGYRSDDAGRNGFTALQEAPFALETRVCTRWEFHKFARAAYDLGARYIGGCCGTEPYHIRAIAEELSTERKRLPAASQKHGMWGEKLALHSRPWMQARASKDYWQKLIPTDGLTHCQPDERYTEDTPDGLPHRQ